MLKRVVAALPAIAIAGTAGAATVSVTDFDQTDWDNFVAASAVTVIEDFEDEGASGGAAEYINGISTAVGTFETTGGPGSGGTVSGLPGNTGVDVAIRTGNVFGRVNTTPGGSWFLDSNDTTEVTWNVSAGGQLFDSLVFSLTDAADQGALFEIFVDGAAVAQYSIQEPPQIPSGEIELVTIDFGMDVSSAMIVFSSDPSNDGFGIDDIAISVVPVPAAGLLLLGGIGALGYMSRRKRKQA